MNAYLIVLLLAFTASAFAESPARDSRESEIRQTALALTDPEFIRLLSQVKTLQQKGERTYLHPDLRALQQDLFPLSPKLIIVRRSSVEFFLSSDPGTPVVMIFWRFVGVWNPRSVLWAVDLKSTGHDDDLRLWSHNESLSDAEAKPERDERRTNE